MSHIPCSPNMVTVHVCSKLYTSWKDHLLEWSRRVSWAFKHRLICVFVEEIQTFGWTTVCVSPRLYRARKSNVLISNYWIWLSYDIKNNADQEAHNTLIDRQNSSYHNEPSLMIVLLYSFKYFQLQQEMLTSPVFKAFARVPRQFQVTKGFFLSQIFFKQQLSSFEWYFCHFR